MSIEVREMFARIAGGYDRLNAALTLGIDARWRRAAVRLLAPRSGERVLDLCCGTGDVALALEAALRPGGAAVGADFCAPMLRLASEKRRARGVAARALPLVAADALALPFAGGAFDAAAVAFGVRNVDDPVAALREMARVVRPGGRVVVLELGRPRPAALAALYERVARRAIPALGAWLGGERAAYQYLPRSAAAFPSGEAFLGLARRAGLEAPRAVPLLLGVAWLYRGEVPAAPPRGHATAARAGTTRGGPSGAPSGARTAAAGCAPEGARRPTCSS